MTARMSINADRLRADLQALARIGAAPGGGITRTSFSAADARARAWYLDRCAQAGLAVEVDGIGNIFVSSPVHRAATADTPAVWSGSHIDTVPDGGWLDGSLGTLAALECLRRLHEEEVPLDRPVRAVVYSDEEGNYSHLLGSSAIARGFTRDQLEALTGRDGDRFRDTFTAAGGDLDRATRTVVDPARIYSTVELHIEQGPRLEELGHQIGVVTAIVGLGGGTITFRGRPDHAGTTPMTMRKDALVAAAALIVRLPEIARSVGDRAVATAGIVAVQPGGANVVPGVARVTVDFRDPDRAGLDELARLISAAAGTVGHQHGVEVDIDFEPAIAPSPLDGEVQAVIAAAAADRGLAASALPSGAGHDSQNLATLAPTGMIFIPSTGGRSHCPEEDSSWDDIGNGANVLLDTIVALARR
jgi:N-carbamoyl-L-amino-acid hydrolase